MTLKLKLAQAICKVKIGGPYPSDERIADAALSTLRQWLADEGLVVVPKARSEWLHEAIRDASLRAANNASVAPQLLYAHILWAMQDALAAAPDTLGET